MVSSRRTSSRFVAFLNFAVVGLALSFGSAVSASAAPLQIKTETDIGSGTTTIISLVPNANGTLAIQAVETGKLTHFGKFTGTFTYTATYVATGIQLVGNGTLTNDKGDTLVTEAFIEEIGADYPFRVAGLLRVVGGTGAYARASGALAVTGSDTTSLTDNLNLAGEIITIK